MKPNDDRDPFRGLAAPRAPSDLRRRVLNAATNATKPAEPQTIWDRIWENPVFGRSWVTLTLGLLVAHAGLTLVSESSDTASELRSAERKQAREVRELLDLPVVEISPRAAALALGGRSRPKKELRPDGSNPLSRS